MTGWLALVGGGEWTGGCDFDAQLLASSGSDSVAVLPTAAAYEHPERAVETAIRWFSALGARVEPVMVLGRADADSDAHAAVVRSARFIYLGGGSPLHLRSVLKDSKLWEALSAAWHDGAVLAGSSAGAMVLGDPMVDPRGGAFTVGLGLIEQLAVAPHFQEWSEERAHRTIALGKGVLVAGIDERTALIRDPEGGWSVRGAGRVALFRDGAEVGLDALPA
jgi:cyanophycinase